MIPAKQHTRRRSILYIQCKNSTIELIRSGCPILLRAVPPVRSPHTRGRILNGGIVKHVSLFWWTRELQSHSWLSLTGCLTALSPVCACKGRPTSQHMLISEATSPTAARRLGLCLPLPDIPQRPSEPSYGRLKIAYSTWQRSHSSMTFLWLWGM